LAFALALAVLAGGLAPSAFAQSSGPRNSGTAASDKSFTDNMACSACHSTTGWRAKGGTQEGQKFDHSTTGFPLTGAHVHAPCVGCHNAKQTIKRACSSCHEDFHRGRLLEACDTCHSPAGWKVTRPLEIHRMTRFPLTGMHVLADCTQCHLRASEQRWTDAPIDCYACHQKDYRRSDLFPVHTGTATSPPLPRDCSICHRAIAWVPALQPSAAVAALVGGPQAPPPNHDLVFPISTGVHRTATCSDCHSSLAVPRAVRCVGCHAHDPVRLMQEHRQAVSNDGAACLSCHVAGARR
jgi:hypothetical protein